MSTDKPADNTFANGDPRYIDVTSAAERAFWVKVLDTTEKELRSAVAAVGTSAQKVKDYLRKS